MVKPYNIHSKEEDANLAKEMDKVCEYANINLKLPEGYVFDRWAKISYEKIYQWHLSNGIQKDDLTHLLKKNPSGKYASIQPDGGMIVAIKKDIGGNIIDWIPILSSEAKHQESNVGNAIERVFKNYNAMKDIFMECDIFPYICFCQGRGLASNFEQNKLIAGMGNDVNLDISINDITFNLLETKNRPCNSKFKKSIVRKIGNVLVRENKWEPSEMYNILLKALKQSYDYFFVDVEWELYTFRPHENN